MRAETEAYDMRLAAVRPLFDQSGQALRGRLDGKVNVVLACLPVARQVWYEQVMSGKGLSDDVPLRAPGKAAMDEDDSRCCISIMLIIRIIGCCRHVCNGRRLHFRFLKVQRCSWHEHS